MPTALWEYLYVAIVDGDGRPHEEWRQAALTLRRPKGTEDVLNS